MLRRTIGSTERTVLVTKRMTFCKNDSTVSTIGKPSTQICELVYCHTCSDMFIMSCQECFYIQIYYILYIFMFTLTTAMSRLWHQHHSHSNHMQVKVCPFLKVLHIKMRNFSRACGFLDSARASSLINVCSKLRLTKLF